MTEDLINRAERVLAEWETASGFLQTTYVERLVERAVTQAVRAAESPWLDRAAAAARWRCSESEIDRASRAGILVRCDRGGTPLFDKAQGDEALRSGKWKI